MVELKLKILEIKATSDLVIEYDFETYIDTARHPLSLLEGLQTSMRSVLRKAETEASTFVIRPLKNVPAQLQLSEDGTVLELAYDAAQPLGLQEFRALRLVRGSGPVSVPASRAFYFPERLDVLVPEPAMEGEDLSMSMSTSQLLNVGTLDSSTNRASLSPATGGGRRSRSISPSRGKMSRPAYPPGYEGPADAS